ncbi:calcium-dependent phosphotriesterase [Durotheca rogersii]|uniref:calcium-dependent phosphotriesterase n=1 Tax=Durotheca rogersii TaxID=419775 RepID=UPI002220EE87|nr:calcium-dependent phosphotriesterase [Durotheca rogersii]KAI5866703.1 calcium-dependent phosphotriesterase [Durotheca rogersii]
MAPSELQIEVIDPFKSESGLVPSLSPDLIKLEQYHPGFERVASKGTLCTLLLTSADSSNNPFFCNACAYVPERDELYITSDLLQPTSSSNLPVILISKVTISRHHDRLEPVNGIREILQVGWMKLRPPSNMPMPNGAAHYRGGVVYCSQGTLDPASGGLWHMPAGKPPVPVVTGYLGRPFNSVRHVAVDAGGSLWFTDSRAGFEHGIRPRPQLPNHVYRFDPETRDLRVVADGFGRPTGIALDPDGGTLYVADAEAALPDGTMDFTRPATIYAFDVVPTRGVPALINRRVFAYAREGAPAAVMCDTGGNVYAACADGVEVWSPAGMAMGRIRVPGGCSNMSFGQNDSELFICAQQRLWRLLLNRR